MGDKKIALTTYESDEMDRWVRAIQNSRDTAKEKLKSKLPKIKNIFWILQTMSRNVT